MYQNLVRIKAQMLDRQDAARSIAKINFLLNEAAAGSADPHAALRANRGLPDVAAPDDRQIANMLAGRAPNDDGPAQGAAQPANAAPAPGPQAAAAAAQVV